MSKIKHIFLDLDGVLVNFDEVFHQYTKEEWINGGFENFVLRGGFCYLDKLLTCDILIDFLSSLDLPITILSSAGGLVESYNDIVFQKIYWLSQNEIKFPALIVPSKDKKADYAFEGAILIDDQEINIKNFIAAGGMGIVHTTVSDTIDQIKALL